MAFVLWAFLQHEAYFEAQTAREPPYQDYDQKEAAVLDVSE